MSELFFHALAMASLITVVAGGLWSAIWFLAATTHGGGDDE